PLLCKFDPSSEVRVFREQPQNYLVGAQNIRRVARERHPSKWPLALAEQQTYVGGYESRIIESVLDPRILGALAPVVSLIQHDRPCRLEVEHGLALAGHCCAAAAGVFARRARAQLDRFIKR